MELLERRDAPAILTLPGPWDSSMTGTILHDDNQDTISGVVTVQVPPGDKALVFIHTAEGVTTGGVATPGQPVVPYTLPCPHTNGGGICVDVVIKSWETGQEMGILVENVEHPPVD